MLHQISRSCKNTVAIIIEEIQDFADNFSLKHQSMRSKKTQIQTQAQTQDSDDDNLPEVKFD